MTYTSVNESAWSSLLFFVRPSLLLLECLYYTTRCLWKLGCGLQSFRWCSRWRTRKKAPFVAATQGINIYIHIYAFLEMRPLLYHGLSQSLEEGWYISLSSSRQYAQKKEKRKLKLKRTLSYGIQVIPTVCCEILRWPTLSHTSRSTIHVCHTGKCLKRGCCCTVSTSKCTAFAAWCGTCSRYYWYTTAERNKKYTHILGFPCAWLPLAGRKVIPWLLARFRDFERPVHARRNPAGTGTFAMVYRRPPCVPRSREREKRPVAGRESYVFRKQTIFY